MKKRLLSALLALALVFVLLPTTALAGSIDPDITIAGTEYDFELENYKENTYKTVYYQHDKFLTKFEYTSDGVWATDPYLELTKTGAGNATTITITVHKGSNTTKAFEIKSAETCIATSSSYWNLVITGSGALSLTHTGTSAAIWSNHSNITITGGVTVNVKGTKSGSNINSYSNAIQCGETFTVSNGATVVAENNSTYSNGPAVKTEKFIISGDAKFEAQSAYGGKAISFDSITADGYDFMGRSGNSGSYTTLTGDDKATELQKYSSIKITPTPTPALEKSNVYVAGTNLYKNTAYTIQNGKPVMGGTYPGNYNIYLDATGSNYVLHVKGANIDARGTTGIYGTSNIVFEGDNSITASTYGIYSYFTQSDLKISGTGSLNVKTIAGDPAIATAYDTSRSIIISGNDFTVTADTSGTTSYAIKSDKDLTITDGAAVTAKSNATRAIDIKGDLTVTNGSLTATSTSDSVPTVQVGGNASFTGSTVTITNNSTTQGKQYEDSNAASSALHVNGAVTISGGTVTAEAKAGGNAIRAVGNITVSNDATVTAKNNSQYFNAITAGRATGGEVNTLYNLIVSGENTRITATNAHDNKLAYGGAINAYIKNANEGHYLKVGTDTKAIAPNVNTTVRNNSLTITRGDKVTRTNSPVVIAGTTLLNDTFYTINGSTVAEGTKSNYNAFYNSTTKTLKLNNAQISTTTNNAAIKIREDLTITVTGTNELNGNYNHCIESDNNFKINGTGRLVMTNGSNTAASVIYCGPYKNLTIAAEVIIKNEAQPGYLIHIDKKDAYSFAEGYNVYASTNVSGSPLEVYNPENYSAYKYLRVTKETLETGGGSTHEHVFSTSWESNADYHWHKCTVQGCTEVSDKEAHVYTNTWWKNSNGNHGRTCDKCRHEGEIHEFIKYYDFADETYHVERCGYLNCTYVGRQETHSYDSFGVCKCGYSPNGLPAPPSLQGVAPTSENGTDGKILNSNIGMEYAQNLNGPWTKWNEHSNITGLSAGTYYVRYTKTDERFPDNQVATVEVPAYTPGGDPTPDIPAAPTGLVGVAPTSENGNGKITGTTAQMEYATSLEGDWTACANDSTDVPAGKYYVRMKKTDNTPAGEAVEVTVPAYSGTGEIVPPTPDNPGTIVIIRPAEEEKPAQQPNPSTGANDLVGLAVAAAVAAALGSAALLRKHD